MTTAYTIASGSRAGALGAATYHGMKVQRRTATLVVKGSWRRRAADAYFVAARERATRSRDELATQVRRLTGRTLTPESIYTDPGRHLAVARVDGVVFRCQHGALQLVRPCVHCGTGEFHSPSIENVVDLGYALEAWQPRCEHCEPADSETSMYEE